MYNAEIRFETDSNYWHDMMESLDYSQDPTMGDLVDMILAYLACPV